METIRIGKKAKELSVIVECSTCETIFAYLPTDIVHQVMYTGMENDYNPLPYVRCPVCKQTRDAEDIETTGGLI